MCWLDMKERGSMDMKEWVECMYIYRRLQPITHINTTSITYRVSLICFVFEFDPLAQLTAEQGRIETKTIVPYD